MKTNECNVKDVLVEDNLASSERRFNDEINSSLTTTNLGKNASNN
jgi:hypothetical protein